MCVLDCYSWSRNLWEGGQVWVCKVHTSVLNPNVCHCPCAESVPILKFHHNFHPFPAGCIYQYIRSSVKIMRGKTWKSVSFSLSYFLNQLVHLRDWTLWRHDAWSNITQSSGFTTITVGYQRSYVNTSHAVYVHQTSWGSERSLILVLKISVRSM